MLLSRLKKVSVKHVFATRRSAIIHLYILVARRRGMVDELERVDDRNLAVTLGAEKGADHYTATVSRQQMIRWRINPYF